MDKKPHKLVVKNIGLLLSGALEQPIFDGDAVVSLGGRIAGFGRLKDLDTDDANIVVDARGVTLAPGLIDSHVHPVAGDWTPRQSQLNWIDSCLHGGVTTMVSAGEVHTPGRPRDIVGLKAMAIAAQRMFDNFRPSGVKVLAESGFEVLEAASGQEALALISEYPSVCAVVSDVAMPGSVNGFELARRLRKELPNLGIVLVSGVLEEDHVYLPLGVRFVAKPVRAATLIRLVREVADLPAGGPLS
jgi:CheY-like chemotaxis protein